ncbi:hypothetical protein F5B22DRAFT_610003 [Xylaria bambusicola]|uniref:uncharacterized protein n=1 Tax=Xylaria bambusicola TaxID=326684 RepID=UPI0020082036|nr:uncharacterized protein F5B22DRAFT_610003 [Xylaria bambusicola]KAI0514854.1 hypothetical protein F5B22DRAFT_610003 [Xylaria bambusicola]
MHLLYLIYLSIFLFLLPFRLKLRYAQLYFVGSGGAQNGILPNRIVAHIISENVTPRKVRMHIDLGRVWIIYLNLSIGRRRDNGLALP